MCACSKIRETLNNLILKQPLEWHTQVALPFVKISAFACMNSHPHSNAALLSFLLTPALFLCVLAVGTTVEWDEIRFDVRLLQRVPYEGVSRMSTSLRRRHRDRVVRRGIGLTIESDFYATGNAVLEPTHDAYSFQSATDDRSFSCL